MCCQSEIRRVDLAGMVEVHPGALIVCVLRDGKVVRVSTERLLSGGRRAAGVRVRELTDGGGSVVSVHPLRSGPEQVLAATDPSPAEVSEQSDSAEIRAETGVSPRQGELDLAE